MDCIDTLQDFIIYNRCTLLGVGPMSKNCVDVTIDLANEFDVPIMLIASRRQIEAKHLGSGYVNNWSTDEFAKYVRKRDIHNKIILCRDHGGPYQNNNEIHEKMQLKEIMDDAKESFRIDIESGFKIIHIDPSENLCTNFKIDEMLNRIFELYSFCYDVSKQSKNEIRIEISIGKEDGEVSNFNEIKYAIEKIEEFCLNKNLPLPIFIVVKTGNYVLETQNVGILDDIIAGKHVNQMKEILKIIEFCGQKKIMVKEHNGDYLSEKTLREHPKIGIHAVNVAPEFGVIETRAILSFLSKHNLDMYKQKFLDISFNSNKWKKWMQPNSNLSQNEKAIISGHYIYSTREFEKLKNEIIKKMDDKNEFDEFLKLAIRNSILKYLKFLNIIK